MIFARFRMDRLLRKIPAQQLLVDILITAEKEYGPGYYTDKLMKEQVKLMNMKSTLDWLSRKR